MVLDCADLITSTKEKETFYKGSKREGRDPCQKFDTPCISIWTISRVHGKISCNREKKQNGETSMANKNRMLFLIKYAEAIRI